MLHPNPYPGKPSISLFRPDTLEEGQRYYLLESKFGRNRLQAVTLVSYTPCPAVVVIASSSGIRQRCLRDELLLI